jgi:hypothetical protein
MRLLGFGAGLCLLAAGAAVVLPRMIGGTRCGNDTAAIATLRNLASVQSRFRDEGRCDVDRDGNGEFGTLAEMTGLIGIRGDATGALRLAVLETPALSLSLANVDDAGVVTKSGYSFRVHLPGRNGKAVVEGRAPSWSGGSCRRHGPCPGNRPPCEECSHPPPKVLIAGNPLLEPVHSDLAETAWCAYAWPTSWGNSGTRVFFVDQTGDVWQTANAETPYSGSAHRPEFDAAMPAGGAGWATPPDAPEYRGRDGRTWKRTN